MENMIKDGSLIKDEAGMYQLSDPNASLIPCNKSRWKGIKDALENCGCGTQHETSPFDEGDGSPCDLGMMHSRADEWCSACVQDDNQCLSGAHTAAEQCTWYCGQAGRSRAFCDETDCGNNACSPDANPGNDCHAKMSMSLNKVVSPFPDAPTRRAGVCQTDNGEQNGKSRDCPDDAQCWDSGTATGGVCVSSVTIEKCTGPAYPPAANAKGCVYCETDKVSKPFLCACGPNNDGAYQGSFGAPPPSSP